MNRRQFLRVAVAASAVAFVPSADAAADRPNLVFVMCDDLGYGDVGFNGNTTILTPHLDRICGKGARFTRFYAGGPVCSPTRGTCLTGRHYLRYGINNANAGCLPRPEITLAEVCRSKGYRTGHFGKWHLGTLTKEEEDSNRGAKKPEFYSPPWDHGFDTCFSTEAKVPTWDPMVTPAEGDNVWGKPGTPYGTAYWNEKGERVTENLAGDDARVIMDRAEPFIREATAANDPFTAVIWFHTPHAPVVAGEQYRAMYAGLPEAQQHYYGCITAMDEQVGRLWNLLEETGVAGNTIVWFCSDNGPEGPGDGDIESRNQGVTGGLRGRKRSLFNGGVGVPAFVVWPGVVAAGSTVTMPCSTLDYFPTVAHVLLYQMPDERPLDGISLLPLLRGGMTERPIPIPYRFSGSEKYMFGAPTLAMTGQRYKYLTNLSDDGAEDLVFDIDADPYERRNIIADVPAIASEYRSRLEAFIESARASHAGKDYPEPYTPVTEFDAPTGGWD